MSDLKYKYKTKRFERWASLSTFADDCGQVFKEKNGEACIPITITALLPIDSRVAEVTESQLEEIVRQFRSHYRYSPERFLQYLKRELFNEPWAEADE
jgi:hypothetical protein